MEERTSARCENPYHETVGKTTYLPAAPGEGGLSVKRRSEAGMFGSKAVYHILGRFEMEAASDD